MVNENKGKMNMELTINEEIQNAVWEPKARISNHSAKKGGKRTGCDFKKIQADNLSNLISGCDGDIGALKSSQGDVVSRPIYIWRKGNEKIIIDGIKTYKEAIKQGKEVEVKELKCEDINEAKVLRWYINVAASRQISEDGRVWNFLQNFAWLIEQWKVEGKKNQGRKGEGRKEQGNVCLNSDKRSVISWRHQVAQFCQTTKSRVDSVYNLRLAAKKIANLSDKERNEPENYNTPQKLGAILR